MDIFVHVLLQYLMLRNATMRTIFHELEHCIDIGHTDIVPSIMNPSLAKGNQPIGYMPWDLAHINWDMWAYGGTTDIRATPHIIRAGKWRWLTIPYLASAAGPAYMVFNIHDNDLAWNLVEYTFLDDTVFKDHRNYFWFENAFQDGQEIFMPRLWKDGKLVEAAMDNFDGWHINYIEDL